MIIGLFGLFGIKAVVQYISGYLQEFLGERIGMDLKMRVYEHVIRLPVQYFDENPSGYISTRIIGDVSAVQGLVVDVFSNLLRDGLTILVGAVAIFYLSWKLAVASIIFLPFYVYFAFVYSKKIKEYSKKVREESALLSGFLKENLLIIRLVKEFCAERWSSLKFYSSQKSYVRRVLALFRVRLKFISFITFINGISPLIVLGFGGYLIMRGEMTLGTLVAFSSFANYLYSPVLGLLSLNQRVQEGMASFERIKEILDKETEHRQGIEVIESSCIEYKDVFFKRGERTILDGISFTIDPGEKVLIKGRSGEGKTTLVNLLFGYIKQDSGRIEISGRDVEKYSLKALRENIGYMSQDVMLFKGTLEENITLGRKVEEEKLKTAIENAGLSETILKLPEKLLTQSGEMGFNLSGGEKKRIGLVRIFLKNPKIIVLDEPFSGVDYEARSGIKEAIDGLFADRTLIVISHDEEEKEYKKVLYLENGLVKETKEG